jgi:NAD(P)-dependent dehydrogenase (short-subunit alcohol dehydrogenase family)
MGILEQRANLPGKVAAVVGGATGIGGAVTVALAAVGVDIAFCDIEGALLEQTRLEVERMGRRVLAVEADALDAAQLDRFFDATEDRFGRLDILVNVVGGTAKRAFTESTREDWLADLHRNFGYAIQSVHRAIPLMRVSGLGGSIINFTTIEAHRGAATLAVYAGAKAGLTNFSRALGVELGVHRIRVNTLASDHTPSAGNWKAIQPAKRERISKLAAGVWDKAFQMITPLKARPPCEALADAVLFLASDLSAFVTGTTLHVDGGTHAAAGVIDWPFGDGFSPMPGLTAAYLFPEAQNSRVET